MSLSQCEVRPIEILHSTRRHLLKKGRIFFSWSPTYFVLYVWTGFVESCKMFLCTKLPFLGWRSEDFLQDFFRQKMFA
jgi:hypothetical protein